MARKKKIRVAHDSLRRVHTLQMLWRVLLCLYVVVASCFAVRDVHLVTFVEEADYYVSGCNSSQQNEVVPTCERGHSLASRTIQHDFQDTQDKMDATLHIGGFTNHFKRNLTWLRTTKTYQLFRDTIEEQLDESGKSHYPVYSCWWKPFIVFETLKVMPRGDYLLYHDASRYVSQGFNRSIHALIDLLECNSGFNGLLPGVAAAPSVEWSFSIGSGISRYSFHSFCNVVLTSGFCRQYDTIQEVTRCCETQFWRRPVVTASFMVFRNDEESKKYLWILIRKFIAVQDVWTNMPIHDQSASGILAAALQQSVLVYQDPTPPPVGVLPNSDFKHINLVLSNLMHLSVQPVPADAFWRKDAVSRSEWLTSACNPITAALVDSNHMYDARSFHPSVVDYQIRPVYNFLHNNTITQDIVDFMQSSVVTKAARIPFGMGDGGVFSSFEYLVFSVEIKMPRSETNNTCGLQGWTTGDDVVGGLLAFRIQMVLENYGAEPWPRHTYLVDSRENFNSTFWSEDNLGVDRHIYSGGWYFAPTDILVSETAIQPGERVPIAFDVPITCNLQPEAAMQWLLTAKSSPHFTCDASRFYVGVQFRLV